MSQHDIAALFRVNSGRVAEAVAKVRKVLEWPGTDPEEEVET